MISSFVTVVLLGAVSLSPIQALDYVDLMGDDASFGGIDPDEEFDLAWNCAWFVFCDLNHIMEMKAIADVLDNRTVLFLAGKVRELFPEIEATNDEIFDTEAWEKRADEIACSFSDEERDKLKKIPLDEYASDVCDENKEDREECDKLAAGMEFTKDMMTNYKEKCAKAKLNDASETK